MQWEFILAIKQIKAFNGKEYEQRKKFVHLFFSRDKQKTERVFRFDFFKALRHLIIYAVLMNRHQLAKVLWKRSSEPIPLALICCMMFKKLAPYCHESYQRLLIEKQAK